MAAALHFYMLVKADVARPVAFATALGSLLLYRLIAYIRHLRAKALRDRSGPPDTAATRAKQWVGQLRVVQVFDETPEVRTFRLASPTEPRLPFDFLPGQYLNLTLDIEGRKIRRSYTIASPPSRVESCELTVKREERGLASRHLHDAIHPGCLIDVRAPAGRFTFTGAEASSIVLIAGGVGITPLMAKIRYLTDVSWTGEIFLVFSAKTERDIIFRDELEALQQRHPNLHVTITLTREDGIGWTGKRGRISSDLLARSIPNIAGRRVHICGPSEMTGPIQQMLRELGVAEASIHLESFVSPGRAAANGKASSAPTNEMTLGLDNGNGVATITFARSRKSAPVRAAETVLEAAETLGVPINYDCRAGICGQCKVQLLSGHVVMEAEDALDASDRENDTILSCQARCLDEVVVEA